jgi:hypothetical protein
MGTTFTYTAWIIRDEEANDVRICSKRDYPSSGLGKVFSCNDIVAANSIQLAVNRNSGVNDAISTAVANTINANQWYFVAGSFDGSNAPKIFKAIPGANVAEVSYQSQAAGSGTVDNDSGGSFIIGASNDSGSNPFDGRIADVRIYNIVLNVNELNSVMRGAHVRPDALKGWWPLWGVSSPEPDWSGNGSVGNITGCAAADHPPNYSILFTQSSGRRVERIMALPTQIYTRQQSGSLPGNDTDLSTAYSAQDYTDVASDNAVRVGITGVVPYLLHQFKDKNTNNTDQITMSWNGQSDLAPSTTAVRLQIYNRNSTTWETLATESSAAANTDFTLSGTVTTNLSNYYDGSFYVSGRVYQG